MRVRPRETGDQRRSRLGHPMAVDMITREQDLGHALQCRGLGCCRIAAHARDKDMHLTQGFDSRKGLGDRIGGKLAFVHIGKKKNRHQITPASSLSLAISSATDPTLTPALRPVGSTVFITVRRGATSTP